MKKNLTLVVMLSLIATAAPKSGSGGPTLNVDCTQLSDGNCDATQSFSFSGDGYSKNKDYEIYGTNAAGGNPFEQFVTADPNGGLPLTSYGIPAGDWTFTIYSVNHNDTPQKTEQTTEATFE